MNANERTRRGRGWIAGAILMVLGVIVVVPSAVKSVVPFFDAISGPTVAVPGEQQVHLSEGDYDLYERTSSERSLTRIRPSAVRVTASDGATVPILGPGSVSSTVEHDSSTYVKVARFTVPDSGDYDVLVAGVVPGEVMLVRSFGAAFDDALPWMAGGAVGAMLFLAGFAVLLVSLLRGWSARAPAHASPSWPPGWYADPSQPGGLRYWDGRVWTAHTHRYD